MITGSIPTASIYATWSENVEIRAADDETLVDLTSLTEATLKLRDPISRFDEMTLTMTNGDITSPSIGILQWRAEASAMGTLEPKLYEAILLLEDTDDTVTLILGPISIIE